MSSKPLPEKKFQTDLCEAARAIGGYALKMSNQFFVGVPDILVKVPLQPGAFIECKTVVWPKRTESPIKIDLSAMQRLVMRDMQRSGLIAVWAVATRADLFFDGKVSEAQFVLVGRDPNATSIPAHIFARQAIRRGKGERWDIREILRVAAL